MDQQEQNSNTLKDSYEFGESSKSPPSTYSTYPRSNTSDIIQHVLKHNGSNRDISDPGKYLDLQRMIIDQGNTVTTLKMSEYEKSLAEKDNTIKSLHTDMMNSQNNNHILTNKCKNLMEKTKLVSHTCLRLNSSFTNICDRLNKLGDTVDNARTRHKYVMDLVDQTTNTFQEKILNISDNIGDSLKHANIEKIRAKQELEILENKYSLDTIAHKSNLEECAKEIENLKTENNLLSEKLNETNIRLNEEKQMVLGLNQNYEKVLKEMEDQNATLINQNKSMDVKYEEILLENQSLKDEINMMKISLDENIKQFDMQLTVIKEQTELLDNLKISEKLNDVLKEDNFSLKEHNEYLVNNNASLKEDISKIKLSHKEILEENESKFKDICKNYDDLLKMQEEKLQEKTEQLLIHNEKEFKIQAEVINLKQAVDVSNNTIFNLQEELKINHVLIPELQSKIDDLNTDLANAYQKLQDSLQDQENIIEINQLKKEKSELENQIKEYFKQIEKLTANYMKYKAKAKQLYVEVMRLRFQCSPSKQKNIPKKSPTIETIELLSDEDVNMEDDDCSIVEFNNNDVTNMDVSIRSFTNKMKRNSSASRQINKVKKRKTSINNNSFRKSTVSTKTLKQKIDVHQIENLLNSSSRSINLKYEDKNIIEIEINKEHNQDLRDKESNISLHEIHHMDNKSKNLVPKKRFRIPADLKSSQKKSKPTNIQNISWSKPNSPVTLIPAPKQSSEPKATVSDNYSFLAD